MTNHLQGNSGLETKLMDIDFLKEISSSLYHILEYIFTHFFKESAIVWKKNPAAR